MVITNAEFFREDKECKAYIRYAFMMIYTPTCTNGQSPK